MSAARFLVAGCFLLAACAAACAAWAPVTRPNVVLVVVDTLRADRVGFAGSRLGLTPFLDRLAAKGTVFERAYATTSWTLPSVASLFTSRYALQHGVVRFRSPLLARETTLAEALAARGFACAGFSANFLLAGALGFGQGFDPWQALVGDLSPGGEPYASAAELRERGLAWLDGPERPAGAPALLYLHFMEPHSPYSPPEPFRSQLLAPGAAPEQVRLAEESLRALQVESLSAEQVAILETLYDAEVAALDRELEVVFADLAARGFLERAVVVVTADHGEEFREHGGLVHGRSLFEEVVRVPLLVMATGRPGGRVVREPVSLIDVAPTVLELLGLPAEAAFEGRSLVPLIEGGASEPAPVLLELAANTDAASDLRIHALGMLRDDRKLLLEPAGGAALFDLRRDPGERSPADPAGSAQGGALREELETLRSRLLRRGDAAVVPLGEELLRQLRALGYLPE
jgi:arylsulfatase A-like enzyme